MLARDVELLCNDCPHSVLFSKTLTRIAALPVVDGCRQCLRLLQASFTRHAEYPDSVALTNVTAASNSANLPCPVLPDSCLSLRERERERERDLVLLASLPVLRFHEMGMQCWKRVRVSFNSEGYND